MKTTAIICELNPIHCGHELVLRLASAENDVTIAVMSGNFTQRGIPAVYDKYARAETAVRCGADIVVELPFPWCSAGTEFFALGGVFTAAGCLAKSLTFGSETGSCDLPCRLADIKSSHNYTESIIRAEKDSRGRGSAVIFDDILRENGIDGTVGANDKLGGEYIRFGRDAGIGEFKAVKRMSNVPSASDIREVLYSGGLDECRNMIVSEACGVFDGAELCCESKLYDVFFGYSRLCIRDDEKNDILRYAAKTAKAVSSTAEFIENLPTKKYTLSRMRRELLFAVLGAGKDDYSAHPKFTQLLAANGNGRAYLGEQGKNFKIPIITKPADFSSLCDEGRKQYALHRKADELYAYLTGKEAEYFIKRHPVIL